MKKMYLSALAKLAMASAAILLFSCGDNNGTKPGGDSLTGGDSSKVTNVLGARVPSPGEMFSFIKLAGTENVKADAMNPLDNAKNYTSKKAMALNFGVYSADALYCSAFNTTLKDKLYQYFVTLKMVGDKLNVTTSISDKDQERITRNLENSDSLLAITNDHYYESFNNLDKDKRGAELSLMLAGGWVEGLYLASNMVTDFSKDQKFAQRIAEQKDAIGNLVEYMKQYESDANVTDALKQIEDLKTSFDKVESSSSNTGAMKKNTKGKMVMGGAKTTVTEAQFKEIKDKVGTIRAAFIAAQ